MPFISLFFLDFYETTQKIYDLTSFCVNLGWYSEFAEPIFNNSSSHCFSFFVVDGSGNSIFSEYISDA